MIIANNATNRLFLTNYNSQNSSLQTSMARLSSGMRLIQPGDAPADLGISERFRAQIKNSEEAGRVVQNAINMFQSTDAWLQEVNDILNRMSELAVSSADGSKSDSDRENLDVEFQQLKSEIARISEAGKYNGLQVNGKAAISVYDHHDHKLRFSQADGTEVRELSISMRDGETSENNVAYAFESSATNGFVGDYLFTEDGKSLIYVAQKSTGSLSARQTLMKLELESNTITTVQMTSAGGASANTQARIVMDDQGRVWVSDPSTATNSAVKNFNVKLLDHEAMSLDGGGSGATNDWAGGVTLASGFSNFSVHGDYIYYIERSGGVAAGKLEFVKQSIYDQTDKTTLVYDLSSSTYNLDKGENYAISQDGQYIAFEDEDGTAGDLVVINTLTGEKYSESMGTRTNSIVGLDFDANNVLYWTDTGSTSDDNSIKRMQILPGDKPEFGEIQTVRKDNAGRLGSYASGMAAYNMGLNVSGGSPASDYRFQVGPDDGMEVSFEAANVQLVKLGISSLSVASQDMARDAIKPLQAAVDKVTLQRAQIGAQVSRLNFIHSANASYADNIAAAESRLRDVDIALETSKLTKAQIMSQTGISVLSQAASASQNVLRLLQ